MRQTARIAALFMIGASAFAADSTLMNLVMPDAQVMAGVNVVTAGISPFGQYVLSHFANNDTGLQSFIATTGFDPRHDVTEILVASSATTTKSGGLVLAKGTFKVDQLISAISNGSAQQVATYNGATLVTSTDPKDANAVAFIDGTVVVAGDVSLVKAAVDRRSGVNSINPQLAARVQDLSSTQDAWSVSMASLGSLIPDLGAATADGPGAMTLQVVKNIQSSSGGVKFGTDIVVTGQAIADTAQNASALADVMRMVSSLAAMGASGQTGAGNSIAQLLQKVTITTDGAAVNMAASFPEADVEAVLKAANVRTATPAAKKMRM